MVLLGLFYVSGFAWWDVKTLWFTLAKTGLGLIRQQIAVIEILNFSWFRPLEGGISQYSYVNSKQLQVSSELYFK